MTFDMNDVAPQQSGDLIPDGTFAKLRMSIRKDIQLPGCDPPLQQFGLGEAVYLS